MHRGNIEPFYFGSSSKPLFGCYHAPQSVTSQDCGVVLCYPMGREYIQFHRAYRQLALRLSRIGFPVFQFDFYGCGDSSGDCEQGWIGQWLADISTAIGEMGRRGGVEKACLVGLRLGGTLAMMAGAERGDIDGMVLWDPVVSGRVYVEELTALHQDMLRYAHVKPKRRPTGEGRAEVVGFPLTDYMVADLENIDLLAIQQKPASNVLLIETNETVDQGRLREYLTSIETRVEYQHFPNPQLWTWIEDFGQILVPHQILQSVISWISEVCS